MLIVGSVLIALPLAACSTTRTGPVMRQGGTLYVAIDSDPVSLNPLVAGDPASIRAYTPLFPLLYSANTDLSPGPDLATTLPTVTASGSVLTVPLRTDAKWSDGTAITADDVVYTVTTEMSPDLDTQATFNWAPLQSVVKVDAHTVKFTLAAPDAAFVADHLVTPIVPQHALAQVNVAQMSRAPFSAAPTVTGGPFRFDHHVSGQQVVLDANPAFYRGAPHFDHVVFVVSPDPSKILNQLGSGQLSWAPALAPTAAAAAASAAGVTLNAYPSTAFVAVMFNVRPGHLFADRAVRQAFAASIDHDGVVLHATGSAQGYPLWGDINPSSWAFNQAALTTVGRDTHHARQLLSGDGWSVPSSGTATRSGRALSAQLIVPSSDPTRAAAASLIAQQTRDGGFNITATGLGDQPFDSALSNGSFDAAVVPVGTTLDPDDSAVLGSGGSANYGGYTNPQLDGLFNSELIATASPTANIEQVRKPIFVHIEQMVSSDQPLYFLWAPRVFTGFNVTVGGVAGVGAQLDDDRNETFYRDWFLTG